MMVRLGDVKSDTTYFFFFFFFVPEVKNDLIGIAIKKKSPFTFRRNEEDWYIENLRRQTFHA